MEISGQDKCWRPPLEVPVNSPSIFPLPVLDTYWRESMRSIKLPKRQSPGDHMARAALPRGAGCAAWHRGKATNPSS